jgi:glycosidase
MWAIVAVACCGTASGQMLARPGWTGSSAIAASSWNHAVLYEIDTRSFQDSDGDGVGDLKGIAQHLDYLQALGIDAIVIDSLEPTSASAGRSLTAPIDPALGTVDDFDALSLEASRHNLRILLELAKPDPALARFWLTRGVAGFRIGGADAGKTGDPAKMQAIRRLLAGYPGRVLITDAGSANAPAKAAANELVVDTDILRLPAAGGAGHAGQLRGALDRAQTLLRGATPVLATDGHGLARDVDRFGDGSGAHAEGTAKILGTVLLLNRSAALIYAGQELGLASADGRPVTMPWGPPPVAAVPPPAPPKPVQPSAPEAYVPYVPPPAPPKREPPDPASAAGQELNPNSVLNFYRELVRLHHGNTALRDGEQISLNHDGESAVVWVRRPASPTYQNPAIVVVCNLSDRPLAISLKGDLARLHLRGSFLRKLLRSDGELGSMDVDPTSVAAFGVYVGELKY